MSAAKSWKPKPRRKCPAQPCVGSCAFSTVILKHLEALHFTSLHWWSVGTSHCRELITSKYSPKQKRKKHMLITVVLKVPLSRVPHHVTISVGGPQWSSAHNPSLPPTRVSERSSRRNFRDCGKPQKPTIWGCFIHTINDALGDNLWICMTGLMYHNYSFYCLGEWSECHWAYLNAIPLGHCSCMPGGIPVWPCQCCW